MDADEAALVAEINAKYPWLSEPGASDEVLIRQLQSKYLWLNEERLPCRPPIQMRAGKPASFSERMAVSSRVAAERQTERSAALAIDRKLDFARKSFAKIEGDRIPSAISDQSCLHEARHAVIGYVLGMRSREVIVHPSGGGSCSLESVAQMVARGLSTKRALLAQALAAIAGGIDGRGPSVSDVAATKAALAQLGLSHRGAEWRVRALLRKHAPEIDAIAEALRTRRILDAADIAAIMEAAT